MSGVWVSIEHAPRDGTPVDLWVRDGDTGSRVTDARWKRPAGLDVEAWCILVPDFGWDHVVWPDSTRRCITHFMLIPEGPRT